jgi:hypothetical protein
MNPQFREMNEEETEEYLKWEKERIKSISN